MHTPARPQPATAISSVMATSNGHGMGRRRPDALVEASTLFGSTVLAQLVLGELVLQSAVDAAEAVGLDEAGADTGDLVVEADEVSGLFGPELLSTGLCPVAGLGAAVAGFPGSSADIPAVPASSSRNDAAAPDAEAGGSVVADGARAVRQGGTPRTDADGRPDPQREVQGTQEAGNEARDSVVSSGSGDPFGPAVADAQNRASAQADEARQQSSEIDGQVPAAPAPMSSAAVPASQQPSGEMALMAW